MSSKELSLESQISDKKQGAESSMNIFSVRNIAIGITVFVLALSCIFTFAFKDQIFGLSKSIETSVQGSDSQLDKILVNKKKSGKDNYEKPINEENIAGAKVESEGKNKTEKDIKSAKNENKKKENEQQNSEVNHGENENMNDKTKNKNSNAVNNNDNIIADSSDDEAAEANAPGNNNNKLVSNSQSSIDGNIVFTNRLGKLSSFSMRYKNLSVNISNIYYDFLLKPVSLSSDLKKVVDKRRNKDEIYISNLMDKSEIIIVNNKKICEYLPPSFSPDDEKIIYAVNNGSKFQIYRIDANKNPEKKDLIQEFEFDKDSESGLDLHLFKYTTDGKFIVALFSKNKKFIFRFIELNDNEELKPFKDIEIDPKKFYKDFEDKSFYIDDFFCFISYNILNFSISKDNSKIVFLFEPDTSKNLKQVYVINRNDTENCIPKKIYETENELRVLNSLYWSPNDEEIILNEKYEKHACSYAIKIMNINSDSSVNEKVEVLKDNKDNIIDGFVLKWNKDEVVN